MAIKFEYTGKIGSGGMFDEDSVKKVTFELDDNDLTVNELLDEFHNFLKGVGYFFKDTQTFEVLDHTADEKSEAQVSKAETQSKVVVDEVELAKEMDRIRQSTLGLSEEAIEMAAYHALLNRKAE